MDVGSLVMTALWVMLPAYLPNSVAVLVGGGQPINGRRTSRGTRILGDGTTWRGAIGGFVAGVLLALGLNELGPLLAVGLPIFPLRAVISLPAGAMLGDIGGSFLKRRLERERGGPAPSLDQLGFALEASLLTWILVPGWFYGTFTLPVLITALVITPVLHLVTNALAYLIGLKDVPW